ncbi:MAG TPA: MgtC/SapB family protein [Longimicrobiaceae bacterium]|nr:MgtC/SapB family protein [Longimicrobiaceae bacterium]
MTPDLLNPYQAEFWIRILSAIACGGIIGLERQIRGKPAGIRTCILICMGTHFFVVLGASFAPETADPTRVLGQVVTGIGFLGAGVILTREGLVVGVTSAAVIWLLAAIGAMIGLGHVAAALTVSFITVIVLVGVERLEKTSKTLRRGVHAWRSSLASSANGTVTGGEDAPVAPGE